MIIDPSLKDYAAYRIHDCTGNIIPWVHSFDTERETVEIAVCLYEDRDDPEKSILLMRETEEQGVIRPVLVAFPLPGAYATKNGERLGPDGEPIKIQ